MVSVAGQLRVDQGRWEHPLGEKNAPVRVLIPEESHMTPDQHQERIDPLPPSAQQLKYLRYLLARAHEKGVPYLPMEALGRSAVSAWIDYLKALVGEEEKNERDSRPNTGGSPLILPVSEEHWRAMDLEDRLELYWQLVDG